MQSRTSLRFDLSWIDMSLRGVERRSNLPQSCGLLRPTGLAMTLSCGRFCDRHKLIRLEACTTHQCTVNFRLCEKFGCVDSRDRTSILDPNGLRDLLSEQISQRRTNDLAMDLIGVFSTGSLSCSNSPHRFVSHNDTPRASMIHGVNSSQANFNLTANNFGRNSRFVLIQSLTHTNDGHKPNLDRRRDLTAYTFI